MATIERIQSIRVMTDDRDVVLMRRRCVGGAVMSDCWEPRLSVVGYLVEFGDWKTSFVSFRIDQYGRIVAISYSGFVFGCVSDDIRSVVAHVVADDVAKSGSPRRFGHRASLERRRISQAVADHLNALHITPQRIAA